MKQALASVVNAGGHRKAGTDPAAAAPSSPTPAAVDRSSRSRRGEKECPRAHDGGSSEPCPPRERQSAGRGPDGARRSARKVLKTCVVCCETSRACQLKARHCSSA